MTTVGIIANPASGKDIRRLVAHGSVFNNQEKVNIVRRVILGLEAAGVDEVLFMPDYFGIVERALDGIRHSIQARCLEMRMQGTQDDSTLAARLMAQAGVGCIVTLGGDGTNRAVAKGSLSVPFMPISTGTNNVFPFMVEGTIAGLAAGVVATGAVPVDQVTFPTNRLDVLLDGEYGDLALVDAAVYDDRFIASRAIWDMSRVREIFIARAAPSHVGLSSIGGCLHCRQLNEHHGVHIHLATPGETRRMQVVAPIAPGLVEAVQVSGYRLLQVGEEVEIQHKPAVLALDGEREVEMNPGQRVAVRLSDQGPRVVEVNRALQAAAQGGCFYPSSEHTMGENGCLLAYRGICLSLCQD